MEHELLHDLLLEALLKGQWHASLVVHRHDYMEEFVVNLSGQLGLWKHSLSQVVVLPILLVIHFISNKILHKVNVGNEFNRDESLPRAMTKVFFPLPCANILQEELVRMLALLKSLMLLVSEGLWVLVVSFHCSLLV